MVSKHVSCVQKNEVTEKQTHPIWR